MLAVCDSGLYKLTRLTGISITPIDPEQAIISVTSAEYAIVDLPITSLMKIRRYISNSSARLIYISMLAM